MNITPSDLWKQEEKKNWPLQCAVLAFIKKSDVSSMCCVDSSTK